MKDNYPASSSAQLPSCPLSAGCVSMLDCIDALDPLSGAEPADDGMSTEEKEHAIQLMEHLHSCKTCTVAVMHARKVRDRQHLALHDFLEEGETQVASTTVNILLALRREKSIRSPFLTADIAVTESSLPSMRRMRRKKTLSYVFALAAAAVFVIVFVQMFNLFSTFHGAMGTAGMANSSASSAGKGPQSAAANGRNSKHMDVNASWSSVLLTRRSADGRQQLVENYDPKTGKAATLLTLSPTTSVDGISHHGDNVVYHDYDSLTRRTTYHFLIGGAVPFNGKGLNAVWSTDDAYITVVMDTGDVWRITMDTMQPTRLPFNIQADTLVMERDSYLYYVYAHSLYRIDVMSAKVAIPQLLVSKAATDVFWLDPYYTDEVKVYYYSDSSNGAQRPGVYDLYAASVSPNGSTKPQQIAKSATLIGYAANGNLMTMVYNQSTQSFELHEIDKTTWEEKPIQKQMMKGSQALCQDANGSQGSICDSSVALSPYTPDAQMLVVGARYPDKSYRVAAFGGDTFQQLRVLPSDSQQVALIGWDKLVVA